MASEFFAPIHPHRKQRAQGRPGALRTHGPRATKKHAAEPQVRAGTTGLPCAMVLLLIRDLPGDQALLSPSSADRSAGLAPALGRQDHTISQSAICCSSNNTPRPSHPAPNVRDDREAPLMWVRDVRKHRRDLPDGARENVHDGQFAHGGNAFARLCPRHCERTRSNPECIRGDSLYFFVAVAPRNDNFSLRRHSGLALSRPGMTAEGSRATRGNVTSGI